MKRVISIFLIMSFGFVPISSQAVEKADNAKLRFINLETLEVSKGSKFTMHLGVDSLNSYLISADAIWVEEQANSKGERQGIYCIGYLPKNADSARVRAVQKGVVTIECSVDRSTPEGTYKLWNLDLATVSCKIKFVMEAADVNGPKCPWANTLYSYRTGSPDYPGDSWATSDQINSLNYETEPFTAVPLIKVKGKAPVSIPEVSFTSIFSKEIQGSFINKYDLDCSLISNSGILETNVIIDWTPRLPLNLASQPSFDELTTFSISNLEPRSKVDISLSCEARDGERASVDYKVITRPR